MVSVDQIRQILNLQPHPAEGGFFAETYRSKECIPAGLFPLHHNGVRSVSTAIYYLLTPESCSTMHRLPTDEIFHFYMGDPVEMLQLFPDRSGRVITLGANILDGMRPQVVVPGSTWQGARLRPGGSFALLGTTMAPGFDYADYEAGLRHELLDAYPRFREMIEALTR